MQSELEQTLDASDALWANTPLPFEFVCFPLGFTLHLKTNSQAVVSAAQQSWRLFRKASDFPPVTLSLGVSQSQQAHPGPPVFRSRDHLLSIVSDAENSVVIDMRAGSAFGWVSPATVADSGFFRYFFLDPAVLSAIEQLCLAPVHAAMVVKDGAGVLLAGDTGAGKSTLAWACARAGWTFVSDDATFLHRGDDSLLAIGNCHSLRLRSGAADLFPEIAGRSPHMRANGKHGFELSVADLPIPVRTSPSGQITEIVFLDRRRTEQPQLAPLPSKDLHRISRTVWYGEQHVRDAQQRAYVRLLNIPWWTLSYTEHQDGVELLETLAAHQSRFAKGGL